MIHFFENLTIISIAIKHPIQMKAIMSDGFIRVIFDEL
ncbi:hypothetical protein P278_17690 [Zhouia amylolytica AD3]|uniref:Uncharacterized protein n=1 Tax=Zhouia amylolytica AD3 TaxID=1286632 RepID=W2URV0_9FLAO|nr:hypothetical protein P278_17690 [Zhouia amylolytica AD3]